MTDPVEALGKVLRESYVTCYPEGDDADWRSDADYTIALLRASGFDVVPTGDAGLDAHPGEGHEFETLCKRCGERGMLNITLITWDETVKVEKYARLSSSDTGGHQHRWVDARNEIVTSGEVCPDCGAIRPSSDTPS